MPEEETEREIEATSQDEKQVQTVKAPFFKNRSNQQKQRQMKKGLKNKNRRINPQNRKR